MSLLKKTKDEINSKIPDFKKKSKFEINYTFRFYHVLIPIPFIILYSQLGSSPLNLLNIDFSGNSKVLTAGAITLVSMNLFVTNLLLTHLKEERESLEKLINQKVHYKDITYFGFSIIILLLVILFLGDTIPPNSRNNIFIYTFYLFLAFIGFLIKQYNIVFKFIHKTTRNEIINNELILEFKQDFYFVALKNIFNKKFHQFFIDKNFKESSRHRILLDDEDKELHEIKFTFKKNKYLKDFNINNAERILKNTPQSLKYIPYSFDGIFNTKEEYVFFRSNIKNEKLLSCIKFSNHNFIPNKDWEMLDVFRRRMKNNIKTGEGLDEDLKQLEELLSIYLNYSNAIQK